MDSHRNRPTLHRLSRVCPMNDSQEGPVPPGAIVFRQHAVYDVLVDVDPERVRDDARNPRTAEPGIARLELDDGLDECVARPFRSRRPPALARGEQSAVLTMRQRLVKRQERRGAQADGDLPDSSWTEEERRQSANPPVAQRELRRPLATTTKHDQLLLEHEMLGDHGSHATGAAQLRSHNGEVQQSDQEVLHARVRVGQRPGAMQRCPILESARELAIRDAHDRRTPPAFTSFGGRVTTWPRKR
jgi:hypothetical protein